NHHLGGIVGIDEPDRAVIEREQETLAFIVGIDLTDGATFAAACLAAHGRDAARALLPAADVGQDHLRAVRHADEEALLQSRKACILALGNEPLVLDLVNAGAPQLRFGIAGLEQSEQGAGLRQAGESERGSAVETAFVELMGGCSREGARPRHLYAPE